MIKNQLMPLFRRTRNVYRKIRRKPIGFVHLTLNGEIPLVREPQSFVKKRILPGPEYTFDELWKGSQLLLDTTKVEGLVVRLNVLEADGRSMATIESLRDLMLLWKKRGRLVYVHSNSFNFLTYYLATAANKILMTEGGDLYTTGVTLTRSFYKDYFQSYGITAQVAQVTPYKAALNFLTYDDMPEEQTENMEWMRDGFYEHIRNNIALARNKSETEVDELINTSPTIDLKAKEMGWVDDLIAPRNIRDYLEESTEKKVVLTEFSEALNRISMPNVKRANIAIIPAIGMIVDGNSGDGYPLPIPIIGDRRVGDNDFNQIVRNIMKNKKIKGAVLYVDSPGGSATASESMLLELGELAKRIPVVAYFNNVAASGGYYISMNTLAIIGQPLTLTSSIGVVNGKFNMDGFYKKRNIKRYHFTRGENANISNSIGKWDQKQMDKINEGLFRVYDLFKGHVSRNRKISIEEVDKFAGGRVFLGVQAKDLNIIDEFGNLFDAIDKVAKIANITKTVPKLFTTDKKKIMPEISTPDTIFKEIKYFSGKSQLLPFDLLEFSV